MARPGHIPYLLLLPILCGMAQPTWGRPKPKPASLAKVAVRDLASRSGEKHYTACCIEAADIASVYVLHAAEDRGSPRGRGPPGRGRHGPGGGGFFAVALPLLTLVAAVALVLTVL